MLGVVSIVSLVCCMGPLSTAAEPKAWLGVRMLPVPDALEAHIGRGGLMIGNIVVDSPADEAGLERYDVIVSFGGKAIEGMEDLLGAISEAGEGAEVELVVIHAGQKKTMSVTLGKYPKGDDWEFKYDEPEEALLDDTFTFRGHRLRRGPQGWVFEPLGRLKGLPEPLLRRFRSFKFDWDDADEEAFIFKSDEDEDWAQKEIRIRIERDGEVLEIHRGKDGKVTVGRTDKDGATSSATYDSLKKLEEEDPEAYGLLRRGGCGRGKGLSWIFRYPDLDELPKLQRRYQKQIELRFGKAQEKLREAMEKAGEGVDAADRSVKILREVLAEKSAAADLDIEVHDDGSIRVVVRKGDARVTYEFKDKDDFKQREPELYERFRDTLE